MTATLTAFNSKLIQKHHLMPAPPWKVPDTDANPEHHLHAAICFSRCDQHSSEIFITELLGKQRNHIKEDRKCRTGWTFLPVEPCHQVVRNWFRAPNHYSRLLLTERPAKLAPRPWLKGGYVPTCRCWLSPVTPNNLRQNQQPIIMWWGGR